MTNKCRYCLVDYVDCFGIYCSLECMMMAQMEEDWAGIDTEGGE